MGMVALSEGSDRISRSATGTLSCSHDVLQLCGRLLVHALEDT